MKINQLVIDGAQFVNLGWMKKISAFVMAKQFKNVAKGKHMNAYVKGQLGYQDTNEISIFRISEMQYLPERKKMVGRT